jgi:hypothetical protein
LEEAGLYLGAVNRAAPYNAKGNNENRSIMDLNDAVLAAGGGTWDRPPEAPLTWSPELRVRRDELLAAYPENQTIGFKSLGPGASSAHRIQSASMLEGYGQAEEDRILDGIDWQRQGHRLFEISTLAPSSGLGFLGGVPHECSWFAMRRSSFLALGGFESRFRSPGGGFVNQDFRNRAMLLPGIRPVLLLGDGVFHQFHGGVCTNVKVEEIPLPRFAQEYSEIRGKPLRASPAPAPLFIGTLDSVTRRFLDSEGA